MASEDPFDELLQLENEFYKEGYEAGVADSTYAGLVEGKVFGIEKGYEKALELGIIYGRALVWSRRLASTDAKETASAQAAGHQDQTHDQDHHRDQDQELALGKLIEAMPKLPNNARLKKNINALLVLTDPLSLPRDNSDDSVSELDGRIVKARAKVKMIATMIGEPVTTTGSTTASTSTGTNQGGITGIEDSTGLNARR